MAVYKDKKNGTWYFKGRYNGKFNTRRGFKSKKDAQKSEDELKGIKLVVRTVDDVANEYIQSLSIRNNGSAYTIRNVYSGHLKDGWGNKRIDKVTINDIRDIQNGMIKKVKKDGSKYSNVMINKVTGTFNAILNYAVRFEYIKRNPCSNFKSLKEIKNTRNINFWTDVQFNQAIQYEKDFMWYCYLVLSYLTGMRKGEVRALKWIDIDFQKGLIHINTHINDKVFNKEHKDSNISQGRKNGKESIVAMDNNIRDLLLHLKNYDMSYDKWHEDTYLFGVFKPVGQYSPNRHLNDIAEKANLPRITIHGLRHSHVSYLISKGLNAYDIAERIGDTVEMVLNVYGHMFPDPQRSVVNILNENFNFLNQTKVISVGQDVGQM